jgi:hypothetical protein
MQEKGDGAFMPAGIGVVVRPLVEPRRSRHRHHGEQVCQQQRHDRALQGRTYQPKGSGHGQAWFSHKPDRHAKEMSGIFFLAAFAVFLCGKQGVTPGKPYA